MNAILFIVTGLIVVAGSSLTALAPIWKEKEKRLRIVGVCVTVGGGVLSIVIGLKSAAKSDALMRSTAQILQTSGKTLSGVSETLQTSRDVLKETQENLDKTKENLEIGKHLFKALAEEKALTAKNLEHITGGNGYCWVVPVHPQPVGLGGDPAYQGNNWWQLALRNSAKRSYRRATFNLCPSRPRKNLERVQYRLHLSSITSKKFQSWLDDTIATPPITLKATESTAASSRPRRAHSSKSSSSSPTRMTGQDTFQSAWLQNRPKNFWRMTATPNDFFAVLPHVAPHRNVIQGDHILEIACGSKDSHRIFEHAGCGGTGRRTGPDFPQ